MHNDMFKSPHTVFLILLMVARVVGVSLARRGMHGPARVVAELAWLFVWLSLGVVV